MLPQPHMPTTQHGRSHELTPARPAARRWSSRAGRPPSPPTRIADLLRPEAVIADLTGRTPEAALAELCEPLATGVDVKKVEHALLDRERSCSTGIGDGVAIPLARIADLRGLTATFGRSRSGIEFGASDAKPCQFFFALFVPEERVGVQLNGVQIGGVQLKALARICSIFSEPAFRAAVLAARDAGQIHRLLLQRDDEQQGRLSSLLRSAQAPTL